MKLPLDIRCLECGQIFCCPNCRIKHENLRHGIEYDCRLCRFRSIAFDATKMSDKLMDHICLNHLPLGCKKCGRQFTTKEDFENINTRCSESGKPEESHHDISISLPDSLPITPKNSLSPTHSGDAPARDGKMFDYLKAKLNDKSEVMTSTPTHPSINKDWGIFQKSFTSSTLSGIHSPNSEVIQSPPADDQNGRETNSPSEILSTINSPPVETALKGIICKTDKGSLVTDGDVGGHQEQSADIATGGNSECSSSSNRTPQDSSSRKKSVTFADQVLAPRRKTTFEFLKPKRTCTPAKLKQSHLGTPRFQAIVNNFEAKANKEFTTPKQNRFTNPEETPPTTIDTNSNIITGRTIQFKQDSPTLDTIDSSPVASQETMTIKAEDQTKNNIVEIKPFTVLSPFEKDLTDLDHYKSCVESPELNESSGITTKSNKNQILPQLIAESIQETLDSALNSQDYTTEIQLSIKITKKTVSINEKKKVFDQVDEIYDNITRERKKMEQVERESTTIWSRLVSGLKWVVWGEDRRWNHLPKGLIKTEGEDEVFIENAITSASKRKRQTAYFYGESPVSKRYRGIDRIRGRRPLDRVLRDEVILPERCQSTDVNELRQMTSASDDNVLNRSF